MFTFELLDLHAKQGSGLISNFIQFFVGTPTYVILGCNCIIQVKGIWSVALEMSYWKFIVSVFWLPPLYSEMNQKGQAEASLKDDKCLH